MRSKTNLLAVVIGTALLTVPLAAEARTAAEVAKRLRERIVTLWEVENLEVTVVPYSQEKTNQGIFKVISVRADAATRQGIALRPLYVKGTGVVLDLPKLFGPEFSVQTKSRESTDMYLVLGEDDLNDGLKFAQDVVPDLKATLRNGQITLTGTYKLLVGNKFRMAGKLDCKDGYKINFVPTAVKLNGVPIPVSAVKILLSKLNPMIDLSQVIMKPRIKSITIHSGKLTIK